MATSTAAIPAAEASRDAHESPSTLVALNHLWERFEGFWRSAVATDRESAVERFVNDRGGALTDDLEREISRRFGRIAGS